MWSDILHAALDGGSTPADIGAHLCLEDIGGGADPADIGAHPSLADIGGGADPADIGAVPGPADIGGGPGFAVWSVLHTGADPDRMLGHMLELLPQVRAHRSLGHAMQIVSTAVSYWEVLLQRHSPVQLGALASRGTWRDFLLHEASKFLGFPPLQLAPWQEGWQKLQVTLLTALGSSPRG